MTKSGFKSIAIVAHESEPKVRDTVALLMSILQTRKFDIWVAKDSHYANSKEVSSCAEGDLPNHCDLVIAVGGDGTMLRAAHLVGHASIPILGINRGRRGFLADIHPEFVQEKVGAILDGSYLRESRMMLTATCTTGDGVTVERQALNDVVIQRGATGQMLDFEVRVDGAYVNTHRGDGLIIATPTGSTAYALSSGGPIMQPGLNAVAMVPICPHTLSDRPVVIPGSSLINIGIRPRFEAEAFVTVDGHVVAEFAKIDRLHVTQSVNRITLLHPDNYDYFEVLRSKLNWGHYGLPEKA